jgi:hypothetical protein
MKLMDISGVVDLGEFEVTSGKVRVTDPCYENDTWCSGEIENVKNGTWKSQVVKKDENMWGNRCARIICAHEKNIGYLLFGQEEVGDNPWKECDFEVGVDSGQAGVFDAALYKTDLKSPIKKIGNAEYYLKSFINMERHCLDIAEKQLAEANNKEGKVYCQEMVDECKATLDRYSSSEYREAEMERAKETTDFYEACCDKTLSDVGAGTIEFGCVSSSGYGDGGYTAYRIEENGETVAIMIDFGLFYDEDEMDGDWE